MCAAVIEIDMNALEFIEAINECLGSTGVKFHLSELKDLVMDQISRAETLDRLSGKFF